MSTQTFWLVFRSSPNVLGRYVLKREFGHILVIGRDDFNWYQVDPTVAQLKFKIMPYYTDRNVPSEIRDKYGWRVVKIEREIRPLEHVNKKAFRMLLPTIGSCVKVVKYIVGIPYFKGLTPYGLYKNLIDLDPESWKDYDIVSIEEVR